MDTKHNTDQDPVATTPDPVAVVDVRGPRFGAAITTIVLAAAIVVQGPVGMTLLAWQVVAFATATAFGLRKAPYGRLFRFAVARFDLGPAKETEPEAPPRFAQTCGLAFAGPGLVAILLGATTLGWVLAGIVLALSSLLALTGLCVGCEIYLVGKRVLARTSN